MLTTGHFAAAGCRNAFAKAKSRETIDPWSDTSGVLDPDLSWTRRPIAGSIVGMTPRTHLVLGGGGAMGAYQAGAVLALFEAGFVPDAVYGCSAGALNAAFLASSPTVDRARELVAWWLDPKVGAVLSPGWRSHARSLVAMAGIGDSRGWLDSRPLARLIAANVPAHDLSELAVPIVATTTCLNCGCARHHDHGPVVDVLLASCALPGLFAPVQFPDGHLHADGGIADGVPVSAALDRAGPDDQVVVIDCGLTAITGRPDVCAAASDVLAAHACGVPVASGRSRPYGLPRAIRLDHEAMRIWQALDITDELLEDAVPVNRYGMVFCADGELIVKFSSRTDPRAGLSRTPSFSRTSKRRSTARSPPARFPSTASGRLSR